MVKLSPTQLNKRNNWRIFQDKITKLSPFETLSGDFVTLVPFDVTNIEDFKSGKTYLLQTLNGWITLSQLAKTKEFGSNGRKGTEKEDFHLTHLKNQIKNIGGIVPIKIGETIFQVHDVISTPGTPKSDFHFVDIDGNEICWISHKDGKSPRHFQQWGGLTEQQDHPEVQEFIKQVQDMCPTGISSGMVISKEISDINIKMRGVYGIDYGKEYGRQNVNVVYQGKLELVDMGDYYTITTNHILLNGMLIKDCYDCILTVMYRQHRCQFGIDNARFAIYPRGGRKLKVVL